MTTQFSARRVAIIGLGLIGGSLAHALRRDAAVEEIVGCVETEADAALARELELTDSVTTDIATAAAGADIVILAVGIDAMAPACRQLANVVSEQTILTDVGSTKTSVIAAVKAELDTDTMTRFVPGHPIAGTEHSGLRAGFYGLFRDRRAIVTPLTDTDAQAVARVEQLWQAIGARVSRMAPAHHDEVLAATSHLPHLLAFALVDTLAAMAERTEIFDYAAGGFADFTRIASSDPALWTQIMFANRDAILPALDEYINELSTLRTSLESEDDNSITQCFQRAKQARDRFLEGSARPGEGS